MKKSAALSVIKLTNQNVAADVVDFMLGRFRAWYQDKGIAVDVISRLARRPTRPADFDARVRAVSHFRTLDSAEALAAANKRKQHLSQSGCCNWRDQFDRLRRALCRKSPC